MADHRALDALTSDMLQGRIGRRSLLKRAAAVGIAGSTLSGLLAACGEGDGADGDVDDEEAAAEADEDVDEADDGDDSDDGDDEATGDVDVESEDVPEVDRERTLFLRWGGQEGRFVDADLWNGYAVGADHQNGLGILHEPLAYYSAFADETHPWLAEDWEYNDDATQLTIYLREGINWSDGEPFTAEDVEFLLNHLNEIGSEVRWGIDVQQFVNSAEATDDYTVVVDFEVPAPRFMFFMTYKYDIGLYPIPKHIFEGEDWSTFTNFDLEEGLPVTTGPWEVVFSSPEQKIIDRRDSWWAVDQGLVDDMPAVERVVYLPFGDETSVAQQLITDQIDCSLDLRPLTIERVIQDNPNVITHTGTEPPYGYVDWWPTALYVHNQESPFDEVNVRWAISHYIDRQQMIDVAYDGAGSTSPLPLPSYPALDPYVEHVSDILEEYDTLAYDPARGDELFEEAGFQKNGDGWWERDGEVLQMTLNGFEVFADIGPVVAEMLRQNGIDAEYAQPPDWNDRIEQGDYRSGFHGHGGSIRDPYATLRLFQSTTVAVPGGHQVNFTRWVNDDYDEIVDEIAGTPMDDTETLMDLFRQAMEIWIPELPNIQIQEWYHRIPMNQTYWTNWPTEDNNYINGAFWHLTFQLILNELERAQ